MSGRKCGSATERCGTRGALPESNTADRRHASAIEPLGGVDGSVCHAGDVARLVAVGAALAVVVLLAGCAGWVPGAPSDVPRSASPGSVTIGALPDRPSVVVHGTAPQPPLDAAFEQDLRTYAAQEHRDPDETIRDGRGQPEFSEVITAVQQSDVGYADAVFHPESEGPPEIRLLRPPTQALLSMLRQRFSLDLRVEWGERLSEEGRDRFSQTVVGIVTEVPGVGRANTGIDADGRLDVEFDGTAAADTVADTILASPSFRRFFVDGEPPTEVGIVRIPNLGVVDLDRAGAERGPRG